MQNRPVEWSSQHDTGKMEDVESSYFIDVTRAQTGMTQTSSMSPFSLARDITEDIYDTEVASVSDDTEVK